MTEGASGLEMVSPEGTRYRFDPGALCLELLYTGGPGKLARHEILHAPDDLARWVTRSRLRLAPSRVRVSKEELAFARLLRDTLWKLAGDRAHGRPEDPSDYALVNEAAAAAPLVPTFTASGGRAWGLPATGTQIISTFARDAVELFTGPWAHRVRECSADDCRLVFVDTSHPGRRRWCAMERCGNRHKVRALRARRNGKRDATSRPTEGTTSADPVTPERPAADVHPGPAAPHPSRPHPSRAISPDRASDAAPGSVAGTGPMPP